MNQESEYTTLSLAVERMLDLLPLLPTDERRHYETVHAKALHIAGRNRAADAALVAECATEGVAVEIVNRAAYQAGYYAASSGQPINAVPQEAESVRDWWLQGWRDSDEGLVVLDLDDDDDDPAPNEVVQGAPNVIFDHVDEDTRTVWFEFPTSGERLTAVETSVALGEIDWASSYVDGLGWNEQQTLAKRFEALEPACIAAWRLALAEIGG